MWHERAREREGDLGSKMYFLRYASQSQSFCIHPAFNYEVWQAKQLNGKCKDCKFDRIEGDERLQLTVLGYSARSWVSVKREG